MRKKNWYKPKAFTHITPKLTLEDSPWVKRYASSKETIENHGFYPLIHRTIVTPRLKAGEDLDGNPIKKHFTYKNRKRESTAKYREIYFPNHLDSHIYSYYAHEILEPLYEAELKKNKKLDESVIAYRRIPLPDDSRCKCNIDFANEVFDEIKKFKDETALLALDISKFFDSLDHKILKQAWTKLVGKKNLEKDHYNIFKSLTGFSFVELKDLLKEFGYKHPNQLIQKEVSCFVKNGHDFRKRIKEKGYLKSNPFRNKDLNNIKTVVGIPQGTPISALLANLYLLEFDREVLHLIENNEAVYRRYSDDILIICLKTDHANIESQVYDLIRKYRLIIQSTKTQKSFFHNGKLIKGEKPVNYLGFQYNGSRKLLKSASLSKFYRKLKRNVKYRALKALEARKKGERRGIVTDATIHRKKLYQQFSFIGGKTFNKKKRNFFSYAYFAARVMNEPNINKQLSNAWKILHMEIKRYEWRYNLASAQIPIEECDWQNCFQDNSEEENFNQMHISQ